MADTILSEAEKEAIYDAERSGALYTRSEIEDIEGNDLVALARAADLLLEEDDDDVALTEEEEAALDAAHQQKVFDRVRAALEGSAAESLFIDTVPGRMHDCPIDLLVGMGIGAAMERNATQLGITRDQLFEILRVAVNPIINEYLITPARRMRLLWDGME